jgi:sterol desaturase/sphingolipid hydroxylase (fatty acid hydroxylase superfamily)
MNTKNQSAGAMTGNIAGASKPSTSGEGGSVARSWMVRLFEEDLPVPDEKWRRWWRFAIAIFAVNFACVVVVDALFNHNIMLGPGLVDTGKSAFEWAFTVIEPLMDQQQWWFLALLLAGGVVVLMVNAMVTYRGFSHYEKNRGEPFPLQVMSTFFLLNAVLVGMMLVMLAFCGLVAWLAGFDFSQGMTIVRGMTEFSHGVVDKVPTLVELPYPLPLIAAILATDFFFYWFHRLGHTNRLYMTPVLTHPTTQPVFAAAPLFLLFSVPFQIIVGVLAKIFGPETMIMEALLLRLMTQFYAPYSHNSAYYEWFGKSRWRMFWGHALGTGNYHYMHHSALPGHEAVNLAGTGFFVWDRVFGTYVKPTREKPPVGLTGQPDLHMNPVRLALSGIAQIVYELKHNRGMKTRCKILFGGTDWAPPVTRDYAVKGG